MSDEKKTKVYRLKQSRMEMGEARIRYWYAMPEGGTPYTELFKPEYWSSLTDRLAIGDMIRVEPDEGNYTADLKVLSTGIGGVRVGEFHKKEWDKVEAPEVLMDTHAVKWAGPHDKWRVLRKSDGDVVQKGFSSESDANKWLADNMVHLQKSAQKAA